MRRKKLRRTHRVKIRTGLPKATWRGFNNLTFETNEIMKDTIYSEDIVNELAILHVRSLPFNDHKIIERAITEITRLRRAKPHKTRKSTKKKHRA